MHPATQRSWRSLLAALVLLGGATTALAQQQDADPPSRVAAVTAREGGVVFAPAGDEEWVALPRNRPLGGGDRLWTDAGARAEVQLGTATVHMNAQSHLGIAALDERVAQFILLQGGLNARVRELAAGENFEIGTPNLAFRASQPGDYRIDVSADGGETRVVVASGLATLYGEGGQSIQLGPGQQAAFAGRQLAQLTGTPFRDDAFGQWAAERNRAEDRSAAARHMPRGVVGYQQLDAYGSWASDPSYGEVWYPAVDSADWVPYREGSWSWIAPWGWTWVDDAPWGFAPFHYGRWAMIGARWAWVPGRLAARPVYAPALVVFLGNAGSRVGWYPLAPGEAWWPGYRASARYTGFVNHGIDLARARQAENHVFRHRPWAVTARDADGFRQGRSVRGDRQPVAPGSFGQTGVLPPQPQRRDDAARPPRLQVVPDGGREAMQQLPSRFWGGGRPGQTRETPQSPRFGQPAPQPRVVQGAPQPRVVQGAAQRPAPAEQRSWPGPDPRPAPGDRRFVQPAPPAPAARRDGDGVRQQYQAGREQQRQQHEAERNARARRMEAARRRQPDQVQRQQQDVQRPSARSASSTT